jgi:GTP-binding protein
MKLAIVGRQNSGKSTLVNYLAGEKRVIVSELPGTTRDAIDVQFALGDRRFVAIDTAGIRRKVRLREAVDFYSLARAERSIRRADVVLLLIDARAEITTVDKKIAGHIAEQVKPCIIAVNKWDLVKGIEPEKFVEYVRSRLHGVDFAPIAFISGKTGHNVSETVALAQELFEQANTRVNTATINQVVQKAVTARSPAPVGRRVPKIYYGTQIGTAPPTIVLFVNDPALFPVVYARHLMNYFRRELPFSEVPLRLYFRPHRAPPRKT